MYLTGQYNTEWSGNEIFLVNAASSKRSFQIKFFDENGGILHETEKISINPYASHRFHLGTIKYLDEGGRTGLFIIWCEAGIRGQHLYRVKGSTIGTVTQLREGLPPFSTEGLTVFISYTMDKKNKSLYELLSRFVKAIGFSVISATESGLAEFSPGTQITNMIDQSNALLAILSRDIKSESDGNTVYYSSQNVIDEIGQATNKPVIMIVEEGVSVPSNIQTRATYITFSRENIEEMLVELMEKMRKAGIV